MVFRCCTIIMATVHSTAPRISDCKYCPFRMQEYWELFVPACPSSEALIDQLIENYDVSKYDSYCELIEEIVNTSSTHPRREDHLIPIVNTIKDFLSIPRNLDDSVLLLSDEDMVRPPEPLTLYQIGGKRAEEAPAAQAGCRDRRWDKKHGRSGKSKNLNLSRTRDELKDWSYAEMDAKMGARHDSLRQREYEQLLQKHSQQAQNLTGATFNQYFVKF